MVHGLEWLEGTEGMTVRAPRPTLAGRCWEGWDSTPRPAAFRRCWAVSPWAWDRTSGGHIQLQPLGDPRPLLPAHHPVLSLVTGPAVHPCTFSLLLSLPLQAAPTFLSLFFLLILEHFCFSF